MDDIFDGIWSHNFVVWFILAFVYMSDCFLIKSWNKKNTTLKIWDAK